MTKKTLPREFSNDITLDTLSQATALEETIRNVSKSHQKGQPLNPENPNWLLEYSILNWGMNFLPHYQELRKLQEELNANVGKMVLLRYATNHHGLILEDQGLGAPWGISGEGNTWQDAYFVFQSRQPLLLPGKTEKSHNLSIGTFCDFNYKIKLSLEIEEEYVCVDREDFSLPTYRRDKDGGKFLFQKEEIELLRQVKPEEFSIENEVGLFGKKYNCSLFMGERAEKAIREVSSVIPKFSGGSTLEYIRAQKPKEGRREEKRVFV